MVRVKICGISDSATAVVAAEAGADAIGLIFAPSRRRVTAAQAREIAAALPPFVTKVGVFVDEERGRIEESIAACGLGAVQLHGAEPPEFCAGFRVPVVKAIRVKDASSLEQMTAYQVDAFLLDTFDASALGGTGRTFDWTLAIQAARTHRTILSGGMTPVNVVEALTRVVPYGVDVSSGVETDGRKDHAKIRDFIRRVREWDVENQYPRVTYQVQTWRP
ncbi:MAG: phosphoribosylanthranilate isomerase [Bacillati bacterium ANGP1]|uniref:N-(5'-phosphoribosyl)anthranilate isomerase n=1 Tax=Candidatus Segetimicrobium genomatis TaxID=2569760 RepID=A0A537LQZ6_9BACT|nr:MAG: phosphoribosylanthranilate isomerase [Terrabacteria group bacterium ANGP1]